MENNKENIEEHKDENLSEQLAETVKDVQGNNVMWVEYSIRLLVAHLASIGEKFDPKKCEWSYVPTFVRYDGKTFAKIKLLLQAEEKKVLIT